MNKIVLLLLTLTLLLSACGKKPSWEDEQVEVSDRLLSDDVTAVWTLDETKQPELGEGTPIRIQITKKDGSPVNEFDITHEKLLHFMIVSKDLSYFNHIHPVYKGNGLFEIANDFPAGGEYRFIADFKPTGGDAMTKLAWVRVKGKPAPVVPMGKETTLVDETDGKKVAMSAEGLGAEQDTTLTFSIRDSATGEPVTNLEPYLGAIGHVVVLSEDGEQYLHVHAEGDQGAGPTAKFETSFPRSGVYKLWAQFQQSGQVFTVSYVIKIP